MDLVIGVLADAVQWHVDFDVFLLVQERVLGQGLEVKLFLLLLHDRLYPLVEHEQVSILLLDHLTDGGMLAQRLARGSQPILGVVEHFFQFIRQNSAAL